MTTATTNVIAKIAAVAAGLGLVLSSFAFAPAARAATVDELQAQINALLAQISAMQGGSTTSASMTFTMDLTLGSTGAEVTALQNFLISKGFAIPAGATGYFGAQTQSALAAFQAANGISPAAGYFGPITRAKVNGMAGGSTGGSTGGTGSTGGLQGDTGEIEDADFISGLNDEEVGEDEEDVEIAGLEIEVGDDSDIEITAVGLDFDYADNGAGASDDLDDYVTEVSIWLNGEEVGRVDVDDMDDDDWTDTISLDDAVIEAGETADLVVAVTGVNNLDSADAGEEWNVEFTSVRFMDGDGAVISETSVGDITGGDSVEDTTTDSDERGFSVETFATASDAELSLDLTDSDEADEINDSHVIDVDDADDTDNEEILAFSLEVEGDSDLWVDEIPVELFSVGLDVQDAMSSVYLWLDGEEIGSENVTIAAANGTVTFDNLDLDLEAGETYEFVVSADLTETNGTLDNGDTVRAEIGTTELQAIEVEDESGEELENADRSGTAIGEAHAVYDAGIMVTFVSAEEDETFTADDSGENDQGTFEITFEVVAFDGDFRIDRSCEEDNGDAAGQGVEFTITNSGDNSTTCTLVSNETDTEDTANTFEVDEGEGNAREFTLTVVATASVTDFAEVSVASINWGAATNDTNANYYTFNLDEFKTGALNLAAIP